ncbi:hypothetical protein [Hanstruepera flava]|uniref:hypothetical protein n=1 Tax=Hanstruepera flava TaxID=2930218 RepID=UPI00202895C4|nr:hypothetical protein [Hanstruepera flava]
MERNIVLIGKTKSYPQGKDDNEVDVLYAYENGIDEIETAERNGKTEYYVLILIKTENAKHPDLKKINADWNEIAGTDLYELEFITENRNEISKSFRYMFDEWLDETIRFKLPVVGFISESKKGELEAKKLLLKVVKKRKWEFWK